MITDKALYGIMVLLLGVALILYVIGLIRKAQYKTIRSWAVIGSPKVEEFTQMLNDHLKNASEIISVSYAMFPQGNGEAYYSALVVYERTVPKKMPQQQTVTPVEPLENVIPLK